MHEKQSVLLIDDDQDYLEAIRGILESSGYKVEVALDGKVALDILSKSVFDLVISEVKTPNLDGIKLMREIRRKGIGVPVIFITAHSEVESYMDLMNMGACDYLNKPVKKRQILLAARTAIEKCRTEACFRPTVRAKGGTS